MLLIYSEGVKLVSFLKYLLNEDFELNPQSNAMERIVNFLFSGLAISVKNNSILLVFIKS